MNLVRPLPFAEALRKLGDRTPIGSDLTSGEWRDVPLALRERAFFSSRVESVRFLQRGKDAIGDFLSGARETLPSGETALKSGSRAEFVRALSAFAQAEGMGPLDPKDAGTIKDITSQKRLELIFDTQTRQAQDYGNWRQGMDPDILDAYPAQRFVRVLPVDQERDAHVPYEDQVRLKSDLAWWIRINQDFGVPWGPWGWGCGHDVEDVDRDTAEELGLIKPGQAAEPALKSFNDRLEASTRGLEPDLVAKLRESFGSQIEIGPGEIRWSGQSKAAPDAPTRPPAAPAPAPAATPDPEVGRPTLEGTLAKLGLRDKATATAADMIRLVDELKEDRPLDVAQVVRGVNGKAVGVLSETGLRQELQQFINFIPAEKLRALPKLQLAASSERKYGGEYNPSTKSIAISAANVDTLAERKRVMFHEAMHWLHMEGSQQFRQAITDHWKKRTAGESATLLAPYGVPGKRDRWYEAYAGRIYPGYDADAGLEVPTRYIEFLAFSPQKQAELWNDRDFRETLLVVLNALF